MDKIEFSSRLKILRAAKGLAQGELARRLGTSKSSVNMYERGEREPSLAMLCRIADFFRVTTDELLGRDLTDSKKERR